MFSPIFFLHVTTPSWIVKKLGKLKIKRKHYMWM